MPRLTPQERQDRVVAAAKKAIEQRPNDLQTILTELYETAQGDFELAHTTHFAIENGEHYCFMKRRLPKHDPK